MAEITLSCPKCGHQDTVDVPSGAVTAHHARESALKGAAGMSGNHPAIGIARLGLALFGAAVTLFDAQPQRCSSCHHWYRRGAG